MDPILIYMQRLMIFTSFGLPMLCGAVGEFAVNIAYGKPATQSSTYIGRADYGDTPGYPYDASLAVDGNTSTSFKNDGCSHTDLNNNSAWWEVDLLDLYNVINITIYQRTDSNTNWLSGFVTKGKVSNNSFVIIDNPKSNMTGKITIPVNTNLKFKGIRIELIKLNDELAPICLCEVEVLAEINVAEKKLAKQSSTYFETTYFNASLAVDGNKDSDFSSKSCSCTNPGDNNPWWSVDLKAVYFIIGIRIYQRMDLERERLKGFTLVGVHANGSHETIQTPQLYQSGVIFIRVAPPRMLKEIRVHLNHSDLPGGPIITLCEVQVFAGIMCAMPPPFPRRGLYKFIPDKEGNWSYNFSLIIHCIEGYIIDGPSSVRCADINHWNGTFGLCSVKRCNQSVPQAAHGVLTFQSGIEGNGTYNTIISLNCTQGYKRDSFGQLLCAEDEQWKGILGLCLVKRCDKHPQQVPHGVLTFNDGLEGIGTYNTTVSLNCTEGHERDRTGQLRCADDEQWLGTLGFCLDVDECIDGEDACRSNGHCINTQGSFSCRCYEGFTGKQCETVIPCHIPDIDPQKGIYELHPVLDRNISYTSYLTIKCKEGYRLIGSGIIRCTSTGEWDTSIGQCTAIQCMVPFVLPNNSIYLYEEGIEGNLTFNSTISFRCQEGYKVYGTDVIRCNEFGVWDRLFGTCHVIYCGWPEDVPNDVPLLIMSGIAGGFSYNATACIQSNEWLTKLGNIYESLRCSSEGYWKGSLRKCFDLTNKESYMDQDGTKIILPIAVLVPICLILIATNIVTFLKYRRYACYQEQPPSEQIQVDITIADQFGSSQNEITKREQTRLSHTIGDVELQRRKIGSEETYSQGTDPYDELQNDHKQHSEYDDLQFKRDVTSNKGTMYEDTEEFAQI